MPVEGGYPAGARVQRTSTTGVRALSSFDGDRTRYAAYAVGALLLAGLAVVAWVVFSRTGDGQATTPVGEPTADVAAGASPTVSAPPPSRPTPSATPTPTATPTATPTPSSTATPPPAPTEQVGTVLFQGGPATGPWQQLGTVAEITHPDAPPSARHSWTNFWSDPAEENQPDELWDQIVVEVTDQLVELGTPVDRPAFGGTPGSEAFNSFGGIQDVYEDDEAFTAQWNGLHEQDGSVNQTYFWYLISFDGVVIDRGPPFAVSEAEAGDVRTSLSTNQSAMRAWAETQGVAGCAGC